MPKHKPTRNNRSGFEFLEADTELFNALIDAHTEYPSILGRYNIQLINEDYLQENQSDVNCIYVVRLDSTLVNTGFAYRQYNTQIQIVIRVSQYDTERAMALVKTTIKAIQQVLLTEPFSSHAKLENINPEYVAPGRLTGCVLTLTCAEIDEDTKLDDQKLMLELRVRASIEHLKEYEKTFPPIKPRPPLPRVERRGEVDEHFAGG